MIDRLVAELNANQKAAVEWASGALLVLAGPGSGKTHVLTLRIARQINDSPDEYFRLLALTFTSKAAAEMKNRLDSIVGEESHRAFVTTYHSFAADLLRQHGSHIGIRPDFMILNQDADREAVLLDAITESAAQGEDVDAEDVRLLPVITYLLENLASNNEIDEYLRDPTAIAKARILYPAYERSLTGANRLDFPSLLLQAHRLLKQNPSVAGQLRLVYPRISVDEFQDTNRAQYEFLRLTVGQKPLDLFVVADDDQIIYQWNGASPDRLRALRQDYDMIVLQLPGNYRCPPQVIEIANRLIVNNSDRTAGKEALVALKGVMPDTDSVRVLRFSRVDEELEGIAEDLALRPEGARGRSVVLARTKKLVEAAAAALGRRGVLASLALRKFEFESAPLRWLHSILRLADGRGDREQLRRLCKAFFELEGLNLRVDEVIAQAAAAGGDYLRSWFESVLAREELTPDTRAFLTTNQIVLVDRLDFMAFSAATQHWFDAVAASLAPQPGPDVFADYSQEVHAWRELVDGVVARYGSELTLHAFLHELDLAPKAAPIPANAVRCLTIHNAKGMEFDHVYLCGLVEDQLPSYQAIKRGGVSLDMQEERRNCFVAITRTQESLTLSYADEYFGWPKQPSRFLVEMGLSLGGTQ